jgi:peptide/nickel transport system permease protein
LTNKWPIFVAMALLLLCVLGPLVWRADPYAVNRMDVLTPPTLAHPLGTDDLGRDMLARTMDAGADTLRVALPASALAFLLGIAYGLLAGMGPRWTDAVLMRLLDAVLAVPTLVLLVAAASLPFFTLGTVSLVLLIGAVAWPGLARLVRGEAIALRERDFVRAAEQMGAGRWYVARTHILPVMGRVLAVNAIFLVGDAILVLSSLSFLGLGVQPPRTSWGGLLQSGLQLVDLGAWWLIVPPGLGIFAALLAASGLGQRLTTGQAGR